MKAVGYLKVERLLEVMKSDYFRRRETTEFVKCPSRSELMVFT